MKFKGFDNNIPIKLKILRTLKRRSHTPEQIRKYLKRLSKEAHFETPLQESIRLSQ
jgi:hypothetical protein